MKSEPGKISLLLLICTEDYNCNYDSSAMLLYPISVAGFCSSLTSIAFNGEQAQSRGTIAQM